MAMTMSEKILAQHAGVPSVSVGDIITCQVDIAACHDMFFTVAGQVDFDRVSRLSHPERCVVIIDHAVPAPTERDALGALKARQFVEKHQIPHFFDVGDHAVIHQLIAEQGFAVPGRVIACGDSHTCAAGAFNTAARGFGPADMLYVWCKGETWYQVSPTILYQLTGQFPNNMVGGKDLFLYLAGTYGDATNCNVEFGGDGLQNVTISQRQSIATMCAEINAEFCIFPCDEVLRAHLAARGYHEMKAVAPDADAGYQDVRSVPLDTLVPYLAKPHFIPHNCCPVKDLAGLPINQVLIGSCSNGRLDDLALAASILKGKHIAKGVRLIITPASQAIYLNAVRAGYVETLIEAGAVVTNATCGACYGGHMGLLAPGERCLSTTTRNFKARMGSPDSEILLCSPATAAASALTGRITDPRTISEEIP